MDRPIARYRIALTILLLSGSGFAWAAPVITAGPVIELCAADCDPIGGVGLAGDQLGILVDDADAATWIVIDRMTGSQVSATVLGNSAGFEMRDLAADGAGGAWMVGFSDSAGLSTPGRWHSSDILTRETFTGVGGTADLLLTSVASDGTAFGVSSSDTATRVLPDGTAVDMTVGLTSELPTSIADSTADGTATVGAGQAQGVLALAGWSGNTLMFIDDVAGGNGVIGRRMDGTLVIVGIRIGETGAQIGAFTDPFGMPTLTPVTDVVDAELAGMDHYDYGYAFGSVENAPAFIDTNSMEVVALSDAGIVGFDSLVAMDFLGGSDWLLVLRGSSHYSLVTITTGDEDSDADGVADSVDNCQLVANPGQEDGNGDLIGNICDADFDDNCIVNVVDLGIFKLSFFTADPVIDLNSNGIVNVVDLGILKNLFFMPPGPGAPGNGCE